MVKIGAELRKLSQK